MTEAYPIRKWQSRPEILKAHLDSLSPSELLKVRPDQYAIRFGSHNRSSSHKYDPDQPRVAAGNPSGGQWTDGSDVESSSEEMLGMETFGAARRSGRSVAFCMTQYAVDGLLCRSLEPPSRRAPCWAQAAERLSACLSRRPIPPLNF